VEVLRTILIPRTEGPPPESPPSCPLSRNVGLRAVLNHGRPPLKGLCRKGAQGAKWAPLLGRSHTRRERYGWSLSASMRVNTAVTAEWSPAKSGGRPMDSRPARM